jgi:hypothetical protein
MPRQVADVLDNPDHRRLQLMLDAEAELRNGRSLVVFQVGQAATKERGLRSRLQTVTQLVLGVAQVDVACAGVEGERGVGGSVVDVVALQALVEGSEAAAENGLAVAEEVFREADARLQCCSRSRPGLLGSRSGPRVPCRSGRRNAVDRLESRAGWIECRLRSRSEPLER